MSIVSWFRNAITAPVARPIRKATYRARLGVEVLEQRDCPDAGLTTYTMKNSALATSLADELEDNTSAATAVIAGFTLESQNYTLNDDYLTRLFSTAN